MNNRKRMNTKAVADARYRSGIGPLGREQRHQLGVMCAMAF